MKVFMGRREMKKELSRKALVASADKLFSKKGVAKTSISDITKGAKVAVGTFYNYFDSKENLVYSLTLEIVDGTKEFAKEEIKSKTPATKILNDITTYLGVSLGARFFLVPFVFAEDGHGAPWWDVLPGKLRSVFANAIRYGQERREFRTDISSTVAADMMFAILRSSFLCSKSSIKNNLNMKLKIFLAGLARKK